MRYAVLSVVLMIILTGCGDFEWFPGPKTASITTSTLADAPTGLPCSQTLTATGGTAPYTWSVTGGNLPQGLSLSTGGIISGTPTAVTTAAAGTNLYVFTVKASDSATNPATATRSLSIFTPTTGWMNDPTGKVHADSLSVDTTSGLTLNVHVANSDSVAHTIQVVVANYDANGKAVGSDVPMTPVTLAAAGSTNATNTIFDTPIVNNWRIKSVTIL